MRTVLVLAGWLAASAALEASALPSRRTAQAPEVTLSSVVQDGCTYDVSVVEVYGFPPTYQTVLTRTAGEGCPYPSGSVVVAEGSYLPPTTSFDISAQYIAVSATQKLSPSGSAHVSLRLVGLDVESLNIVTATTLAAMAPPTYPYQPQLGNVTSGTVHIFGRNLIVNGEFNGLIPGQIGTGTSYVAFFANFFGPAGQAIVFAY